MKGARVGAPEEMCAGEGVWDGAEDQSPQMNTMIRSGSYRGAELGRAWLWHSACICMGVAVLMLLTGGQAAMAAPPTVNDLFYGDGDYLNLPRHALRDLDGRQRD